MTKSISVFAPATVANVSCAFDVLGFAVEEPGDVVTVRKSTSKESSIKSITGDNNKLPKDLNKNTAGVAALAFLKHVDSKIGVEIEIQKNMPLGSGLGSSASSSVASLFAINELFGKPLSIEELLPFAIKSEEIACGAAHADNVAPCLFGGFILIRSYDPLDITQIPAPANLHCTIVHPQIEINTEDARKILRSDVPLQTAVQQWGNIAGLVAGLFRSDFDLISRSLEDKIFEPNRSLLIPGFKKVKKSALTSGALGCGISGSGPSMFALSNSLDTANKVALKMVSTFEDEGINATSYVSPINSKGPKII